MFRLKGGPRDGQLVDELPGGYVCTDHSEEYLFDEFVAQLATWEREQTAWR